MKATPIDPTGPARETASARLPSKRLLLLTVWAGTVLYAAALIADLTAGAVVGILVGMFVSLAVCSIHRIWHRNILLLLALGSWVLVTLLVIAHCQFAASPVCGLRPFAVSWLPTLFYALCWLAWSFSVALDGRRAK